jgi:LuxR family maltose regulon positive regulatory protein
MLAGGNNRFAAEQYALCGLLGHRTALLLGWGPTAAEVLHWATTGIPESAEVRMMRARAQLVLGRRGAAGQIIQPVLDGTVSAVQPWSLIEAWLLAGEIALSEEDGDRARRAIKQALVIAQRLDVLYPVVFAAPETTDLLTSQLGRLGRTTGRFAERVLTRRRALRVPPMVALTARERAVLRLLPSLRSFDEIAEDLTVSANTVKTHVRAIYAKLGVTRRRDAVVVALERGLLERCLIVHQFRMRNPRSRSIADECAQREIHSPHPRRKTCFTGRPTRDLLPWKGAVSGHSIVHMRLAGDRPSDSWWPIPRVKTATPPVPAAFVARDELRGRLNDLAARFPVTLLCSPAGYGKTLLLADWIDKAGSADKARISLDAGDNVPGRFWTAVLRAVGACAVVPPSSRLHELSPPETSDTAAFLAEVVDGLAALSTPLYLILDDLQEIIGEETWHDIATLLRHLPKSLRLVLSSRSDPPLLLARLRMQGMLAELRAKDMCFTYDEAARLLRLAGVELDEEHVRTLTDQTEGWPAGLQLAARSLREVPDREAFLAEFAGSDRAIADFLVSEVLARLPAATTEVLRMVSVCDEVTPALAAVLAGREDAGAILVGLERDSSLVLGVGPDRHWFRVHSLLRSYLRADLTRHSPRTVAKLHETAAAWFAAKKQPDKALDHVVRTGADRTTADLLYRHAATVLFAGDTHQSVRRALTKVGTAVVARSPGLALIAELADLAAGEYGLDHADLARAWSADLEPDLVRMRRLVLTTNALIRGRPPPPSMASDWRDVLAVHEATELEAWARLGLGWTRMCHGERTEARHEFEVAERLARDHGFDYLTLHCMSALAALAGRDGNLTTMETTALAALRLADANGWTSSPWLSADHIMIGFARLMRMDTTAALDRARQAAAALVPETETSLMRYLIDTLTGAAYVDADRGQEGLELLRRVRRDHGNAALPKPLLIAGALIEHRCSLELGHDVRAQQLVTWTRNRVGDVAEVGLMQAWTSFSHDDVRAAEQAVRDMLDSSRPALRPTTRLEARLLETALEIRMDRRTKALAALDAALMLAEPEALIEPFHRADVSVRQLLLEHVGGFGPTNDFAKRISNSMSILDKKPMDELTGREQAVLIRLSSAQSLDELASDMLVSVNTVKTHVRAIYAKLGVNNRRAAVVAGLRRGLH